MDNYNEIFNRLWEHAENEIVEFKWAETGYDIDTLIQIRQLHSPN